MKLDISVGYIGAGLLFLLGGAIIFSPLEYHVTDTTELTYTYLNETTGVLNSTFQNRTGVYEVWTDTTSDGGLVLNHILGVLVAISGIVIIAALTLRREKKV